MLEPPTENANISVKEIDDQLEINAHYRGYLKKQKADILAFKRDENLKIPLNVNYDELSGLSNEVKSKFKLIRPKNTRPSSENRWNYASCCIYFTFPCQKRDK